MRAYLPIAASIAAFSLISSAISAPPEGKGGGKGGGDEDPPTVFEPEFAGVGIGGRNKPDEIVMSDRSGDTVVSIHSTSEDIVSLDLSIDTKGLVAFGTLEGNIYIQQYAAPFSVSDPELVFENGDLVGSVEFSANGEKIAFLAADSSIPGGATLYICDLGQTPSPLRCSSSERQSALDGWDLNLVRFDPYDVNGVMLNARPNDSYDWGIYKYSLGGPAPDPTPFIAYPHGFNDVGKAHPTNESLIVYSRTGTPLFWSAEDGRRVYPDFAGVGYDFKFNCSNDALIYAETGATGGGFLAVTEFGGPVEKLTAKGWNTKRQDWIPKASCGVATQTNSQPKVIKF